MINKSRKGKPVSEKDFEQIKGLIGYDLSLAKVKAISGRSLITVGLIKKATDYQDYKKLSTAFSEKYAKPKGQRETEVELPKLNITGSDAMAQELAENSRLLREVLSILKGGSKQSTKRVVEETEEVELNDEIVRLNAKPKNVSRKMGFNIWKGKS